MDVSAITCTGDRPVQFDICLRIMDRMNPKPNQWIIVDDGRIPIDKDIIPQSATYIRREPNKQDYPMTLSLNMLEAYPHIKYNKLIFIEDDDWYPVNYMSKMIKESNGYDVYGSSRRRFFNLKLDSYYEFIKGWESITASMILNSRKAINFWFDICKKYLDGNGLDTYFWKEFNGSKKTIPHNLNAMSIGIKGWRVGRSGGYAPSHNGDFGYSKDTDRAKLQNWIGGDFNWYSQDNINPKLNFVIYSPPYKNCSAGIRVLYKLADMLNGLGHTAICTDKEPNIQDNFIVIYPEIVKGNPWNAKNVVRYYLNVAGKLGGNEINDASEMMVGYSKQFGNFKDSEILFIDVFNGFDYSYEEKYIESCFWIGKGKYVDCDCIKDSIEITRTYPHTREELAVLLKRTKVFYSFDYCTGLTEEAKRAGCKVYYIINGIPEEVDVDSDFSKEKLQLEIFIYRCQKFIRENK